MLGACYHRRAMRRLPSPLGPLADVALVPKLGSISPPSDSHICAALRVDGCAEEQWTLFRRRRIAPAMRLAHRLGLTRTLPAHPETAKPSARRRARSRPLSCDGDSFVLSPSVPEEFLGPPKQGMRVSARGVGTGRLRRPGPSARNSGKPWEQAFGANVRQGMRAGRPAVRWRPRQCSTSNSRTWRSEDE